MFIDDVIGIVNCLYHILRMYMMLISFIRVYTKLCHDIYSCIVIGINVPTHVTHV